MALDPQAKALLDGMAANPAPKISDLPVEAGREMYRQMAAQLDPVDTPIGRTEDLSFEGPGGTVAVRVYTPVAAGSGALPAIIYFHGGGWVIGDLETHDALCRTLANETGAKVIAVDYRLAPEHPYPAAVEDCYAAVRWVEQQASALGIDANRLAVAGDSAGGNLSAVVCQKALREKGPQLCFQLLIYPVTDAAADTESRRLFGSGYFLETDTMNWFYDKYVPNPGDRTQPDVSPAQAPSLKGLPPALVITAGFDILRDEGAAYARALQAAGVAARHVDYEGMVHGFFNMQGVLDVAKTAVRDAAAALRDALK